MKPCGCTEGECWKRALHTGQHCAFDELYPGARAETVREFTLRRQMQEAFARMDRDILTDAP